MRERLRVPPYLTALSIGSEVLVGGSGLTTT
jgi:hypothetical protein